jgi:hypothetical protein
VRSGSACEYCFVAATAAIVIDRDATVIVVADEETWL